MGSSTCQIAAYENGILKASMSREGANPKAKSLDSARTWGRVDSHPQHFKFLDLGRVGPPEKDPEFSGRF